METFKLKAEDPLLNDNYDNSLYNQSGFILNLQTLISDTVEPPYSISLNGDWGSGKTTVLKSLEEDLIKDKFEVLWFNPWEYERSNDVVLVFLQQLSNLAKGDYSDVLTELSIIGKTILAGAVDTVARFFTNGNLSVENIQKIHELVERDSQSKYDTYSSFVDEIKSDFKKLTNKISEKKQDKPLIIILDDLDRCLPENALELIEALKNIFIVKDAKAIFIAGIDTNIAKMFIQSKYKGLPDEFAYNYFKKIFNSTINLPNFDKIQIHNFIDSYLKKWSTNLINSDEKEFIAGCLIYAEVKSIRSVQNIFANFYLYKKLNKNSSLNNNQVMILNVFKEIWPSEYERLLMQCRKNPSVSISNILSREIDPIDRKNDDKLSYKFNQTYSHKYFRETEGSQLIY